MQRPGASCLRGGEMLRTRCWPGHLLLTLSREWEGNGISHDACKNVEVMADAAARVLISQRWQVSCR